MSSFAILFMLLGLAAVAWLTGRARAAQLAAIRPAGTDTAPAQAVRPHSLPQYHGWYVALWTFIPAIIFFTIWTIIAPGLVTAQVLADPAAASLPTEPFVRSAILGEARALATGALQQGFNPQSAALVEPYRAAAAQYNTIGIIGALLLAFAGGAFGFTRLRRDFRARTQVERVVMLVLLIASLVAILTTFGIVFSLVFESARFFSMIPASEFLFGTNWQPTSGGITPDTFGAVPLFWGTILIGAIIAMIVAIPLGLMTAIYLTQYAHPKVRAWLKPIIEILAGIPTVVYGYFAALTVGPALRAFSDWAGIQGASSDSALAAGLVMGIMIIPLVSSMADDSIAAVPSAMRDGSLALGATPSETIRKVLIPAALPGVMGGVLLAVSRAIGETMIVVMAAGQSANLTGNPFASVTTVTVQIVKLMTGDQEFDSAKTLAAFALGLMLFIVTLLLNIVALTIVKRYRESYE
ncbi:MAG: phosphate ABC transporter permease subunit PstC [Sphingopyxis sp.]|jgi:phosphate transport system permease protein|nr:phosphate ABC transporter permease subunit PstC [Sphingopyxis sp.]